MSQLDKHGQGDRDQGCDSDGEMWRLTKFLMGSAFLTALIFWPYTLKALSAV